MSLSPLSSEVRWLPGWQSIVSAMMIAVFLVLLKIALDVLKKKLNELMPDRSKSSVATTVYTTAPLLFRQLHEYNFFLWERELKERLKKEGFNAAIESPLPENDDINVTAYTRILGGVPERLQSSIITTNSAFQAFSQLKSLYGEKSQERQCKLEDEFAGLKLKAYDHKSVSTFIGEFNTAVARLKSAGGDVKVARFRKLLAATLPESDDVLLDCVKSNICLSTTEEEAVERYQTSCQALQKKGSTVDDVAQAVQFRQGGLHANGRRFDRRGPFNERNFGGLTCFSCGKPGHIARACPEKSEVFKKKEEEVKEQNKQFSVYPYVFYDRQAVVCVDSGTSAHHLPALSMFSQIDRSKKGTVTMANGHQSPVLGIGDAVVYSDAEALQLRDVWFTPDFENGLFSVSRLTDEGFIVVFDKKKAVVTHEVIEPSDGHVEFTFPREGNFYQTGVSSITDLTFAVMSSTDLHSAWGILERKRLKKLKQRFPVLNFESPEFCKTCVLGKQRHLPYKSTNNKSYQPLELIHTNICESKCRGFDGSWYFVTFVDDCTKYAEIFPLKNKSSASVLKSF